MAHINNGKTEAKGNGMPGLAAGSFMLVSWTILFFSALIGFGIAVRIFPNGFENGQIKGFGIPSTVLATAMGGQLLFWYIWKKGWKSNAK